MGKNHFDLSANEIILAYFLIHFFTLLLDFIWYWGRQLELVSPIPLKDFQFTPGSVFRMYYIYLLVPTLLVLWVAQKEGKVRYPAFPSNKIFMASLFALLIYLAASIVARGYDSKLHFLGYNIHYNSTILLYAVVAFFLAYLFRRHGIIKSILFVALGVLAVSELWELPLMFSWSNANKVIFLVGWLNRDLPLFLWFYLFRNIYVKFIRNYWLFVVGLVVSIIVFTMGAREGGWGWQYGLLLRLMYAMLLVFVPFGCVLMAKEIKRDE